VSNFDDDNTDDYNGNVSPYNAPKNERKMLVLWFSGTPNIVGGNDQIIL
jgi:hypothetical protein